MLLFKMNYAPEALWQAGSNGKRFNLLFSALDNHTLYKDDSSATAALHLDPLATSFSTPTAQLALSVSSAILNVFTASFLMLG